jgi:Tol biopolymer transport system component
MLFVPPPGSNLGRENLALAPDEQTLAFQVREKDAVTAALMVVPTSGGPARALLKIAQPETFPFGAFAWTADSTQVLAVRSRDKTSELWLVSVDGRSGRKVEFPSRSVAQSRMNPNGRTIAFTSSLTRPGLAPYGQGGPSARVVLVSREADQQKAPGRSRGLFLMQ